MTGSLVLDRAALTAAYLEQVRLSGASAAELTGGMSTDPGVLLNQFAPGLQYLSRPVLATRADAGQLYADVETVRGMLVSLPDRLFGGDLAAFARAAGATGYQNDALTASRSDPMSPQARADLYEEAGGFQLMEFNMGSALGGMENADVCRVMLRHPVLAAFAAAHQLTFTDTAAQQIASLRAASGFGPGTTPVVAVTDWPSSYHSKLGGYMRQLAVRWRDYGLDAHACHAGELEVRGGRVWLAGRAVDVISRMFMLDYLLEPGAAELMDPLLAAAARGQVAMVTPLDSELFGSKIGLAMICDERNQAEFTAAERAAAGRLVPWTRQVRPGPVTLADGRQADLLDYAAGHQQELLLKPALSYGGQQVLAGWDARTSPALWRERLSQAVNGPYVLQRRIRPVPELFPAGPGQQQPWIVVWGVYTGTGGFGGIISRACTVASGTTVLNVSAGAHLGCCLYPGPG
ncbi:MAG TPA: hypothetical protein VH637_10090 [Streptosporangiaceae bacterium]|jgi:hypothetical protein